MTMKILEMKKSKTETGNNIAPPTILGVYSDVLLSLCLRGEKLIERIDPNRQNNRKQEHRAALEVMVQVLAVRVLERVLENFNLLGPPFVGTNHRGNPHITRIVNEFFKRVTQYPFYKCQ